jgi:hypothetical protein
VTTSTVYAVSVRQVPADLVSVSLAHNNSSAVVSTPDHLFFVQKSGWVPAGELDVGRDQLVGIGLRPDLGPLQGRQGQGLQASSNTGSVTRTQREFSDTVTVYNVFAEKTHTYYVGQEGVLVHACTGMNIGPLDPTPAAGQNTRAPLRDILPSALVLDAFAPAASVLDNRQTATADMLARLGTLHCLGMGDWVTVVGAWGRDGVVLLDHTRRAVRVVSRAAIGSAAQPSGDFVCPKDAITHSISLKAEDIPFAATLGRHGDIYVSYFGLDIVEHYSLSPADGAFDMIAIPKSDPKEKGASGLALCGSARDRLCVAYVAFSCSALDCVTVCFLFIDMI